MRSSTYYTLTEFARELGINPWRMAQISTDQTNGGILSGPSVKNGKCPCIEQYGYSNPGRDDFIRAIEFGETMFQLWTRSYPGPVAVLNERHEYQVDNQGAWQSIKTRSYPVSKIGVYQHELLDTPSTNLAPVTPEVVMTVTVPAGTTADELHVFFTEDDAGQEVDPGKLEWEIRPLQIQVSGTTAIIRGPVYLFVKPSLYLNSGCLAHTTATYVESVNVYRRKIDPCQQGRFVYAPQCDDPPCSETYSPACFVHEGSNWYTPQFSECVNGQQTAYKPRKQRPGAVEINYVTGHPFSNGQLQHKIRRIIFMLTVANADFSLDACCEDNAKRRWKQYQSVNRTVVSTRGGSPTFALLLSDEDMKRLRGLPPNQGNLSAYVQAKALFLSVSGSLL